MVLDIGGEVDFSDQVSFDHIITGEAMLTDFAVEKDGEPAVLDVDYTIDNGIIKFIKKGAYTLTMTNEAIYSWYRDDPEKWGPAEVSVDIMVDVEYTVSGQITYSGSPLEGVAIEYADGTTATTDASGQYEFTVDYGATVTITPSLSDYTFTPASITLANITENKPNQNFVATKMNIAETDINSLLQVYPNPTTGELLVTSYELRVTSVEVYDVLGQLLKSKIVNLKSKINIDISGLPDGIYVVKVHLSNGEVVVQRLVKQ
jgi:hypothetical protein